MNTFSSYLIFVLSVSAVFGDQPCVNTINVPQQSEWSISETNPSAKATSTSEQAPAPASVSVPYLESLPLYAPLQKSAWTIPSAPITVPSAPITVSRASIDIPSAPITVSRGPIDIPSTPIAVPSPVIPIKTANVAAAPVSLPCPQVSAVSLQSSQNDQNGETIIHRPAPIVVKRPPTKIQINHPPLVVKPAPVVFHKPPAKVVRPTLVKNFPPSVQVEPVFMKVLKPAARKVFVSEPPCPTAGIHTSYAK